MHLGLFHFVVSHRSTDDLPLIRHIIGYQKKKGINVEIAEKKIAHLTSAEISGVRSRTTRVLPENMESSYSTFRIALNAPYSLIGINRCPNIHPRGMHLVVRR